MSDFKREKARGLFHLTKEYLYLANDGHPFDREGVLALCLANLSGKGDSIIDRHKDVPDKNWIGAHNKSTLEVYQKEQNRIQADFKNEESTVREYSGRWLFELLQNVDDANGAKDVSHYIGTKGLGFLSIFEIARNPAIFSGNFAFEFSQDKTKEALVNLGVGVEQASLAPNLHVPWPSEPDKEISLLLGQGYSTVIRFKLKQGFYTDIREVLNNFEYHFMLFSQNLNWLRIKIGEKEKTIESFNDQISGSSLKSKHKIILKTTLPGRKARTEEWIKWQRNWESSEEIKKRSNCMFCLPFENQKCVPHSTETNVYNFFPTEEPSSIFGSAALVSFVYSTFDTFAISSTGFSRC